MPVVGIDIGGSKMRGVVWSGTRVLRAKTVGTPHGKVVFERTLRALVQGLGGGDRRVPVGIGCAGVIQGTKVVWSTNIPFLVNFDMAKFLGRRVRLDNDARAFARGEYRRGAAKGVRRALFLTFGTGVGRAYGERNRIESVKRFEYPERWEKRYQAIRGMKKLGSFAAEHVFPIVRRYKPTVIVVGGAVGGCAGFVPRFRAALRTRGFTGNTVRSKLGAYAGAIGAVLLFP
ncbi:MAG: ROK family protein [Candidatus Jorgensenbacteria bacterium]